MTVASRTPDSHDPRIASFQPVRHRRAADEVLLMLADAIRSGLYRPGENLPRVRDLAKALGVSTAVVREAVGMLREAGVVSVKRGNTGGIRVEAPGNLAVVLRRVQGESASNARGLIEVRRPLEMTAAALATRYATDDDLAHLGDLVDELADLRGSPREFFLVDGMFHYALAERCGNSALANALTPVLDQIVALLSGLPSGRIDQAEALRHQQRTMRAIASRDRRRALRAMDRHLWPLEEALLGERLTSP